MSLTISNCSPHQFELIKKYIAQFELDDRSLHPSQFLVASVNNTIVGFGRIREYTNCAEMCSLGVIVPERHKGVGTELSTALMKKTKLPLYLVCIIPDYFKKLGFEICNQYPSELLDKLNYCTSSLVVPETYVVMKKQS